MNIARNFRNITPKKAVQLQKELREKVILKWDGRNISSIGGVDVSFKNIKAICSIAVFSYPELETMESSRVEMPVTFPYVPGLLAFREGPAVMAAWANLIEKPDMLMFDGQGLAHPRKFGIGCHIGVSLGIPAIGVAKSRLYGTHEEPDYNKGEYSYIYDEKAPGEIVGAVVRTRTDVKPVYVSPGHLIDLQKSIQITLNCCIKYRLPEPARWAHRVAGGEEFIHSQK